MLVRDILQEASNSRQNKKAKAKQQYQDHMYENLGSFIGMTVNEKSATSIQNFMIDYEVTNPVPKDELHVTIFETEKFLKGFEPMGVFDEPIFVVGFTLEVWQGQNSNSILVARFDSNKIRERHEEVKKQFPDAEHVQSEFIPHITLSYDTSEMKNDIELDKWSYYFNEYVKYVELDYEYIEPRKTDESFN